MLFQITLPGLFGLLLQQVQLFALLLQRPFNLLHKAEGGVQGTGTDHALPRRGDTRLILVVIADQLLAPLLFRLQWLLQLTPAAQQPLLFPFGHIQSDLQALGARMLSHALAPLAAGGDGNSSSNSCLLLTRSAPSCKPWRSMALMRGKRSMAASSNGSLPG